MKYLFALILFSFLYIPGSSFGQTEKYVCYPCGNDCDEKIYDSPGKCPDCGMDLIEYSRVKFQNITDDELCAIIAGDKDIVLLDVRTQEEYDSKGDKLINSYGHLKNAILIPSGEIKERAGEIEQYKKSEVLVYCSHGHRSAVVSQFLTDNGFSSVKNLLGGISVLSGRNDLNCKDDIIEK